MQHYAVQRQSSRGRHAAQSHNLCCLINAVDAEKYRVAFESGGEEVWIPDPEHTRLGRAPVPRPGRVSVGVELSFQVK